MDNDGHYLLSREIPYHVTTQDYSGRGFLLRFILSPGDKAAFEAIDNCIRKAMEVRSHYR